MTPPFGRAISRAALIAHKPRDRCQVDNGAGAAPAHCFRRFARDEKASEQIYIENLAKDFRAGLKRGDIARDPGRIDDAGKRAKIAFARSDRLYDRILISNIKTLKAQFGAMPELFARRGEIALADIGTDCAPALGEHGLDDGKSNS